MSDFDDFDDLDAVRDFRAGVGLMTPAVDERIRRRIIDLAIARGVADGSRPDDGTDRRGPTEPTIVLDLSADGSKPPAPAGTGSSDGSAASVVELHTAARPPARQPRMLVAAAAILVVVVLVAGAVLAARRNERDGIDTANSPPASATIGITSIDELKARLGEQPHLQLDATNYIQTNDGRVEPSRTDPQGSEGTFKYDLIQERTSTGDGFRLYDVTNGSFTPTGSQASTTSEPPSAQPPAPFAGRTYQEVQAMADLEVDALRATLVANSSGGVESYATVTDALQLLRLPITPPTTRARLVDVITTGAFVTAEAVADGGTFRLVIRNRTADETVTIHFAVDSGGVLGWEHRLAGTEVDSVVAHETPTVLP